MTPVHLTCAATVLRQTAAQFGATFTLKTCAFVQAVALTASVLALVTQEVSWAAAGRLVSGTNCTVSSIVAVIPTGVQVTVWPCKAFQAPTGRRTCRGRCACASILAEVPALVHLTSFSSIVRLAATFGLLVGIQGTAATVQTLDQAGATGRRDRRQGGSGQLHTCAVVQRASVGTDADWSAGAQQTQPFTFLPVAGIRHLRLLVAVVQSYICGVVHSSCQVLNGAFAKLIHSEDVVVAVGDAIDVVLKDIDAEGVMEHVLIAVYSHNHIAAIQPHTADQREFSISPEQTFVEVVHR